MKLTHLIISLALLLGFALPGGGAMHPASASRPTTLDTSNLWEIVAPGIEYREFYTPAPNHLYVARMQRDDPQVILESSIGQGRLSGGAETVRGMAERYDQAINYWDEIWGNRNQVVVAINGYYYDTDTGVPYRGQVQSGWYAKRFDERQSGSGVAWTLDRQFFIGGCVIHRPAKQVITLHSGKTITFDGINIPRSENSLVIYTPQFDATTLTDDSGVEILVELERPLLIVPEPKQVQGVVRQVTEGQGNSAIPFDHIVISAAGQAAEGLSAEVKVGDPIGISQEIRHLAADCQTPNPADWSNVYASVGASYVFLQDGLITQLYDLGAVLHNPRTAVAYNERYIFFIVVDGRDWYRSIGMSMADMAIFAKLYLNAQWGVAMDGGGSSTIVVNGEVKNNPNPEKDSQGGQTGKVERAVANGLMMVVVQPKEQSAHFQSGSPVWISSAGPAAVYLGPGDNYGILATLPAGSQGVVLDHPLNGVSAKGSYWWKISFDNLSGWVSEQALVDSAP